MLFLLAVPISAVYFTYGMVGIIAFPLLFASYVVSIIAVLIVGIIGLFVQEALISKMKKFKVLITIAISILVALVSYYKILLPTEALVLGLTGLTATWITSIMFGVAVSIIAIIIIVAAMVAFNDNYY